MKINVKSLVLGIGIIILCFSLFNVYCHFKNTYKREKEREELLEKVEISENIKDGKIVTIIVDSKSKIWKKENDMLKYHYSLEFVVYKHGNNDVKEILLGFWPTRGLAFYENMEELTDISTFLIYEYIKKDAGKSGFSVLFNPDAKTGMSTLGGTLK